jgi:heptosyltransferase-2
MSNPRTLTKILAIRTDRFGEFILTLPALHALKKKFPESRLTLMLNPYNVELVEDSPDIDEIIGYNEKRFRGFWGTLRLAGEIRRHNFDTIVIFNPQKKFNLASFLAGIPLRIGYDRKWGFLLNKKIKDLKCSGIKHEVDYNLDLVRLLGAETQEKNFPIVTNPDSENYINRLLAGLRLQAGKFIVIHPWTSDPVKQWPVEYFADLIKRIDKELGLKIIIIGASIDEARSKDFSGRLSANIINLVGQTTLGQLTALLKRTALLISNDSGPVHLASALDIPVVALFCSAISGKSSRRWGPYGAGYIVIESQNLEDISSDEVFDKVKVMIAAKSI